MRRFRLFACALLAFFLPTGCTLFKQTQPPSGYARMVEHGDIKDAAARAEAYRQIFPPQPKLDMRNVTLRLVQSLGPDSLPVRMNYASLGPETVRMNVFQQNINTAFLDLTVVNHVMTAAFPNEREAYVGTVGGEGSPFARALGVDPGDFWHVYDVGRRIGMEQWLKKSRLRSIELRPDAPSPDGLQWVRIDRATGLPSAARWRRADREWTVRYRAWGRFGDSRVAEGGTLFVMPREVDVHSSDPKVTLRLEMADQARYQFGEQSPPRLFTPPELVRYRVHPLEGIGPALERKMRELARQ